MLCRRQKPQHPTLRCALHVGWLISTCCCHFCILRFGHILFLDCVPTYWSQMMLLIDDNYLQVSERLNFDHAVIMVKRPLGFLLFLVVTFNHDLASQEIVLPFTESLISVLDAVYHWVHQMCNQEFLDGWIGIMWLRQKPNPSKARPTHESTATGTCR